MKRAWEAADAGTDDPRVLDMKGGVSGPMYRKAVPTCARESRAKAGSTRVQADGMGRATHPHNTGTENEGGAGNREAPDTGANVRGLVSPF